MAPLLSKIWLIKIRAASVPYRSSASIRPCPSTKARTLVVAGCCTDDEPIPGTAPRSIVPAIVFLLTVSALSSQGETSHKGQPHAHPWHSDETSASALEEYCHRDRFRS